MKKDQLNRRTFLKGSVAAVSLAGLAGCGTVNTVNTVPASAVRKGRILAPNDKLNIACIGAGGKGNSDIKGVSSENIVGICDVDLSRAQGAIKDHPSAKVYQDYRKMLTELDSQIDAVTVSTPDHTHFPAAMMAMRMGKHVFVQKPMAHTVWEARQMRLTAKKHNVQTIMGIQGHAKDGPRMVSEWIDAGLIGPVHEVTYWTNRAIWPQGIERSPGSDPIPDSLDWDLWLGAAPERPFLAFDRKNPGGKNGYHPFAWRGWWDFGCGALGDIGCHAMDAAFWALKLGSPTSIEAKVSGLHKETAPKWSVVTYQFPARGDMPPVKVTWCDGVDDDPSKGENKPPRPEFLEADRKLPGKIGGQAIVGEKAAILADTYCASPRIVPEATMKACQKAGLPPERIPRIPEANHYQEWIGACKGGTPAGANFDYSGPLTEMVVLGNLAVRTGKRIEWDGDKMCCTNYAPANDLLTKEYRKGWDFWRA